MENLSNFKRRKQNIDNLKCLKNIIKDFYIPNDIIFQISNNNKRLRSIILRTINENIKEIIDINYSLSQNLRYLTNIKFLEIKNTRKLFLDSLRHLKLKKLTLDGIFSFDFTNIKYLNCSCLILKNLDLNLDSLVLLIKTCSPNSLIFDKITVIDDNLLIFNKFYDFLMRSKVKNFFHINSFCNKKNLYQIYVKFDTFYYKSVDIDYFINLNGHIKKCFIKEESDFIENMKNIEIEYLSLFNQESFIYIYKYPNVKYLSLCNINIDLSYVKNLNLNLIKLKMESVNFFEDIAFYEFINKLRITLRYLEINSATFPTDGKSYLKKRLKNCQVKMGKSCSFFID